MRARTGRRPPGALPPLHPLQLGRRVHLHDAVDLAVGMRVVLASILLLAVHEDGRDAKVARLGRGIGDAAAAVLGSVELGLGDPAFLQALSDVGAELLVVGVSRPVVLVELGLKIFAGGPCDEGV